MINTCGYKLHYIALLSMTTLCVKQRCLTAQVFLQNKTITYSVQCVHEKVIHMIFGHNFCECRPFSKFFHWQILKESVQITVTENSTSPEPHCYTTVLNSKIQNSHVSKMTHSSFHHFFLKC